VQPGTLPVLTGRKRIHRFVYRQDRPTNRYAIRLALPPIGELKPPRAQRVDMVGSPTASLSVRGQRGLGYCELRGADPVGERRRHDLAESRVDVGCNCVAEVV